MNITLDSIGRNIQFSSIVTLSALLMACTPMTPLSGAMKGDLTGLYAQIQANEVGPNDQFDIGGGWLYTPFCAFVAQTSSTNTQLQLLIDHGAKLDQKCSGATPLSVVSHSMWQYKYPHPNPAMLALYTDRARFLVGRGAHLSTGGATMEDVNRAVEDTAAAMAAANPIADAADAYLLKKKQEDAKNSFFTAENLGAVVSVANGAMNNYAAARSRTVPTAIPILEAQRTQQQSQRIQLAQAPQQANTNAQLASNNSKLAASQLKSATATPYGGSLSSCNAPDSMTKGVNGIPPACANNRNNTFGWGNSAADACDAARRSIVTEFDAQSKNRSGCYCKENNAKVNQVDQRAVCWIAFDY